MSSKPESLARTNPALIAIVIFVAVAWLHFLNGVEQVPSDSRWSIYTAMSMIYEGDTNLDEYQSVVDLNGNYGIHEHDGHLYNSYPLGASLLVVPLLVPVLFILNRTGFGHMWFAAIIILHWLVISSTQSWWGGYSFGPRLFSDMIPYFIYFLIPVMVCAGAQELEETGAHRNARSPGCSGVHHQLFRRDVL